MAIIDEIPHGCQTVGMWFLGLKMGYAPDSVVEKDDQILSNCGVPNLETNLYFQHFLSLVPTG